MAVSHKIKHAVSSLVVCVMRHLLGGLLWQLLLHSSTCLIMLMCFSILLCRRGCDHRHSADDRVLVSRQAFVQSIADGIEPAMLQPGTSWGVQASVVIQQGLWGVQADHHSLAPLLLAGVQAKPGGEVLQVVGLVEGSGGELQLPAKL